MAASEGNTNAETSKMEPAGSTIDAIAQASNPNGAGESSSVHRSSSEKTGLSSHRHQQLSGRPPHAPYSNRQHGYAAQYAHYTGSTRPPQQLQSVVTSSFSAEDERDPSHRGTFPPVPRHVSIHINQQDQQRWGAPPEDRYPPEQLEAEGREMEPEGRQQPPSEDAPSSGSPSIVPPSPSSRGRLPGLSTGSGSGGSFMGPPEPLKRSFWHHSRPNDEYNSSLPPEFIPPKRTKLSASPRSQRCGDPARPPNALDIRDMRRPPIFFDRSMSWDSREDGSYYHAPHRESPRYSDHGRSNYSNYGGPPHHHSNHHPHHRPSPSPQGSYRDEDMNSLSDHSRSRGLPSSSRSHHQHLYSHQDIGYHRHPSSPSHAAGSHHTRRWSHHDSWEMPSPASHSRRNPGTYHHSHGVVSTMQYRDDMESPSRSWSQGRDRESMPPLDDHRRIPRFDADMEHETYGMSSPYNPSPYYGRSMPPLNKMQQSSPVSIDRNELPMDAPGHTGSTNGRHSSMDDGAHSGPETRVNADNIHEGKTAMGKDGSLLLLALPQDRISLSETLCVVRENIEVFTATKADVDAPAPGRKHAVVVGQVGLRCIHCRHTTRSGERVKRAVCYPSSIKRIYRTVIDMKLDHFLQCKFVPTALKERLTELKVKHTRSTGTTMQYFIRAANSLGLEDGPSGVHLNSEARHRLTDVSPAALKQAPVKELALPTVPIANLPQREKPKADEAGNPDPPAVSTSSDLRSIPRMDSLSSEASTLAAEKASESDTFFTGKINLALPEDKMALSPLRCFLRSQVCAFSATAEDIAVRAPTTFSITVGQVGIGCIHCVDQPSKLRSNRAVCFPFSISRIYQSVADIQRFHFGECKMLPPDVKDMFLKLQSASSKGSKGLATRQYWVTSAKKLGLVDTARGIRFGRDPSKPEQTSMSLDILAQVAFNVTTASRALVLPEDKPFIAEFLYVVMEQLQPCRFTEADRNKRRLKDVGCIGVECKHCAGQVDGRKFFWSSVNAVESNFVSVHTHMMECRMVPDELKEKLAELKKLRKEQTAALKTGSQKAFFSRVWSRLHGADKKKREKEEGNGAPVNSANSSASPTSSPALSSGCPSPMMSENDSVVVAGVSDDMRQMSVVEI